MSLGRKGIHVLMDGWIHGWMDGQIDEPTVVFGGRLSGWSHWVCRLQDRWPAKTHSPRVLQHTEQTHDTPC